MRDACGYFNCLQVKLWSPNISKWEVDVAFDPKSALQRKRNLPTWVAFNDVANTDSSPFSLQYDDLMLRDPKTFLAGNLQSNFKNWSLLLDAIDEEERWWISSWIKDGVDIAPMFRPFKGKFKGKNYDCSVPPFFYQSNSASCSANPSLVAQALEDRIANGSLELLGWWEDLSMDKKLPICIMPLTLDMTKGRLCHDERFLNLFINDMPFKLDTLREVPRVLQKDDYMITLDDKSGYDHVLLKQTCRPFFGICFAGWVMRYNTLPFGFKAACNIYQRIGMVVTSWLRRKGIPALQYIDDRLIVVSSNAASSVEAQDQARRVGLILNLLTDLGFTLSLHKCVLNPVQSVRFLGFTVDSNQQSFLLPQDKKASFGDLRETILEQKTVGLKSLQRFSGKCASLAIAVPGALFYIREVNSAISRAMKNSRQIELSGALREEIMHWRFLDDWDGASYWRSESHFNIHIATDASLFRWAGIILSGEKKGQQISDYFQVADERPIHLKETEAVINVLQTLGPSLQNNRVLIKTDSKALQGAWNSQGSRNHLFNDLMKRLFQQTLRYNLLLKLDYVNTKENPADAPSRYMAQSDVMLSSEVWQKVQSKYGPHTADLMSLDSNSMTDLVGKPLRHFTPYPTPMSSGVDVLAQNIEQEENPYVHPPTSLISAILSLLKEIM